MSQLNDKIIIFPKFANLRPMATLAVVGVLLVRQRQFVIFDVTGVNGAATA